VLPFWLALPPLPPRSRYDRTRAVDATPSHQRRTCAATPPVWMRRIGGARAAGWRGVTQQPSLSALAAVEALCYHLLLECSSGVAPPPQPPPCRYRCHRWRWLRRHLPRRKTLSTLWLALPDLIGTCSLPRTVPLRSPPPQSRPPDARPLASPPLTGVWHHGTAADVAGIHEPVSHGGSASPLALASDD